jgi:hypothetical protein
VRRYFIPPAGSHSPISSPCLSGGGSLVEVQFVSVSPPFLHQKGLWHGECVKACNRPSALWSIFVGSSTGQVRR